MHLRLLEVITPIKRPKPSLQKELCPLPIPHYQTPSRQPLFILRNHQIHLLCLEVAESPDDAIRRYDGYVLTHELLQPRGLHDVLLDLEGGVHDKAACVEVPDVGAVWELGEGVAEGDDGCPGVGGGVEVVV